MALHAKAFEVEAEANPAWTLPLFRVLRIAVVQAGSVSLRREDSLAVEIASVLDPKRVQDGRRNVAERHRSIRGSQGAASTRNLHEEQRDAARPVFQSSPPAVEDFGSGGCATAGFVRIRG